MKELDFDIGISLSAVSIFAEPDSDLNIINDDDESGSGLSPEEFLRRFSRYNFGDFCLGLLLTNRIFEDLVLGLSWRGNASGVGGICQRLARFRFDGRIYSFNAAFATFRSRKQNLIPLRTAALNILHELMHSFGAKHDSDSDSCSPKDYLSDGRFLMSKYSNSGNKKNHQFLSECAKNDVKEVLASEQRTKCLRSKLQIVNID